MPAERIETWTKRLRMPAYSVHDAARYARVSVQTIHNWQKAQGSYVPALAHREKREALSYLQTVELRLVAAMRQAGLALKKIRAAREYLAHRLQSDYPFAMQRLMTDGQDILQDMEKSDGPAFQGTVLVANKGGQLAWTSIIGDTFKEFEYERDWALRWHVAGLGSPVVIDPRIAFGAPIVDGVPTWALVGRFGAGETPQEIADDFKLPIALVKAALEFEQSTTTGKTKRRVVH